MAKIDFYKKRQSQEDIVLSNQRVSNKKSNKKTKPQTFAYYIRSMRKLTYSQNNQVLSSGRRETMSSREHAELLGISHEMYRKILNKQKPNQSRDCIIAICATLQMQFNEINKALRLYDNGMPKLARGNPRDKKIIEILSGIETIRIEIINRCLERNGFAPLAIIEHRKKSASESKSVSKSYPYEVLQTEVTTSTDYLINEDPYNSLATGYDFSRYHCYAKMWLDDTEKKLVYRLEAKPEGICVLEKLSLPEESESSIVTYESPKDAGEFYDCFIELQGMAKTEQKKMEEFLNDTKNYYERIGAGIHNCRIHIFYETYNYTVPEFEEYYLFEYVDGVFRLTVAKHSLFMQKYLSEREYAFHYGTPENCELLQFDSIEEIDQLISAERIGSKKDILQLRRNAYQKYQCKVEECLNQLRNKKAYVRNLNEIWDDPDRVCEFFGVEREYQCETVGENRDIMIAGKKESVFTLTDGTTMSLSLEELHRAFELGFNTIEEICCVKIQNGSVEAALN